MLLNFLLYIIFCYVLGYTKTHIMSTPVYTHLYPTYTYLYVHHTLTHYNLYFQNIVKYYTDKNNTSYNRAKDEKHLTKCVLGTDCTLMLYLEVIDENYRKSVEKDILLLLLNNE